MVAVGVREKSLKIQAQERTSSLDSLFLDCECQDNTKLVVVILCPNCFTIRPPLTRTLFASSSSPSLLPFLTNTQPSGRNSNTLPIDHANNNKKQITDHRAIGLSDFTCRSAHNLAFTNKFVISCAISLRAD